MTHDGFEPVRSDSGRAWFHVQAIPSLPWHIKTPDAADVDDVNWFLGVAKDTYPINPGEYVPLANSVRFGLDKYLSVREGVGGTIFDRDGYYSQHGFMLSACSRFKEDVIQTHLYLMVKYQNIERNNYFAGRFSAPFDSSSSSNYYHFLIEAMLAVLVLDRYGMLNTPIMMVGSAGLLPWQQEILSLMGVRNYLIIDGTKTDVVSAGNLAWVEHRNLVDLGPEYLREIRMRMLSAAGLDQSKSDGDRLYIRRNAYARRIANRADLEAMLISLGFRVVDIDNLTVKEQIALHWNASVIVAPHGAGLSNILFASPNARVIELMPDDVVRTYYWLIASAVGLRYSFFRCVGASFYAPMQIDVSALKRTINIFLD